MTTYDPKQMAIDALTGAIPPLHSGLKSFQSEEGVHALATALEMALDGDSLTQRENERLGDEIDTLQDRVDKANGKLESVRGSLESEELTEGLVKKLLEIIDR